VSVCVSVVSGGATFPASPLSAWVRSLVRAPGGCVVFRRRARFLIFRLYGFTAELVTLVFSVVRP